MNAQQRQLFRKLNAFNYDEYNAIIHYKNTGEFPAGLNARQQARYAEKFDDRFYAAGNELRYHDDHFELVVIRSNDAARNARLNTLFTDKQIGMGKGIRQFYEIVIHRFLNITRAQVESFLKSQTNYQLTRKMVTASNPTKKYNNANSAWVCDLIDMATYGTRNQNHNYILSVLDLYTKKCYLRALRHKTAAAVRNAFQTFTTPLNKPRVLFSDNGGEFQAELDAFLNENGIRHVTTESHSPEPHIENLNGQIRKMLGELGARKKTLVWHTDLPQIEANLNSYNTLTRVVQKREAARDDRIAHADDEAPPSKYEIGNIVRISNRAIEPRIRHSYKEGGQKAIYIKYSVDTYAISHVFHPSHRNGFYKYGVRENNVGAAQIMNTDGTISRFRESDLMLIPHGVLRGDNMTLAQSVLLNRIG